MCCDSEHQWALKGQPLKLPPNKRLPMLITSRKLLMKMLLQKGSMIMKTRQNIMLIKLF